MKYSKTSTVSGAWAKGEDLINIKRAKIVSETSPQPSSFTNKDGSPKTQDVCKVKFDGVVGDGKTEIFNLSMNRATLNGLIDAFGDDSINWKNQVLSVETEKVRVSGKIRTAVYLIPEGYEKVDNEEGFAEVRRMGLAKRLGKNDIDEIPIIEEGKDNIDVKDIPF